MPALREVELDMMELSRWLLKNESVDSFRHFLEHARSLTRLSLSYMRLPHEYVQTLAQALVNDTCSIRQLFLDRCDSLSRESAWAMAQMLRYNTSLQQLHLVVKDYEDAIPMAQALQENNTQSQLTKLLLRTYQHPRIVRPAVYQAFSSMLQHNCRIQTLEMYQGHPMRPWRDLQDPQLLLYLKLNRAGRAQVMANDKKEQQPNNEEWAKIIIAARDDVDCSFYFLSQNPSVCQATN
eukprot:Sro506_g156260.2  (237) ;mRNA; r:7248-7958